MAENSHSSVNEPKVIKGLSGSEIKYIAILTMLIDHIAWPFVPTESVSGQIMHAIGRITAPVMCFFISEGYHHTRNLKKYFLRLSVFALISHFAFSYYKGGVLLNIKNPSMITTLTFALLAVHIYNSKKIFAGYKLPLLLFVAYFAGYGDWGADAIIFTLAFEIARGERKKQLIAYSGAALYYVFPVIVSLIRGSDGVVGSIYRFGVFIPVLLLLLYNGERGGSKYSKWIFYIFYPAHLFFLGYLNAKYGWS